MSCLLCAGQLKGQDLSFSVKPFLGHLSGGSLIKACWILRPRRKPEHTDFSPTLWEWDAEGVKGTTARMEQFCVPALVVQLYTAALVTEGEMPPAPGAKGFGGATKLTGAIADEVRVPMWLGKSYQLQRQTAGSSETTFHRWSLRIGHSPLRTKAGWRQGLPQIRCCSRSPGLRGFTTVASPRLGWKRSIHSRRHGWVLKPPIAIRKQDLGRSSLAAAMH